MTDKITTLHRRYHYHLLKLQPYTVIIIIIYYLLKLQPYNVIIIIIY